MSSKHGFVFTMAALAAAASLMSWNKVAMTLDPASGDFPEDFDPTDGQALQENLEAFVPENVDDRHAWLTAICEEADPATWAAVQADNAAHRQAQADQRRERAEKNAKIVAAISAASGVEPFLLNLALQSGAIGIAPAATRAVEVEGVGTLHVFGLEGLAEKMATALPPGMLDMLRALGGGGDCGDPSCPEHGHGG